jgi:hypothetical protein
MQTLRVRSQPVSINNDTVLSVPHLVEEQEDLAIITFEKAVDLAQERDIYRKEPFPPRLHLFGDWTIELNVAVGSDDILETLLSGGEPLFKADVLLNNLHDVVNVKSFKQGEFSERWRQQEAMAAKTANEMGIAQERITDSIYNGSLKQNKGKSIWNEEDDYSHPISTNAYKHIKQPKSTYIIKDGETDSHDDDWDEGAYPSLGGFSNGE